MKLALVQSQLYWENKEKNFQHFNAVIDEQKDEMDVIVLPEMFSTGFSMNSHLLAEEIGHTTTEWLLKKAQDKNACITGSFISTDGKNYYNTLLWAYPDGHYQYYHKRHLFRMAGEHNYYASDKKKIICEYKGFKFLPLICYDLRFPVWSRNKINPSEGYDVLIYVANWPKVRIDAWKKLIYARSIENLSYVVAVNRTGTDGTSKEYNGHSMVVNYKGELMADLQDKNMVQIVDLHKEELIEFREHFPAHLDADEFEIKY